MSEFREISFIGADLAAFVLFPAAIGAAAAGIAGRRRIAVGLLVIALGAVVLPLALGVVSLLADPTID